MVPIGRGRLDRVRRPALTSDHMASAAQPSEGWLAVVAAERRLTEAVMALPQDELPATLSWALADFSSRRAALSVLTSAHPQLTSAVLLALQPLLLVSHSLLEECRRLILRLPPAERSEFLERLSATVVGDVSSDDEAYRRAAELLRTAGLPNPSPIWFARLPSQPTPTSPRSAKTSPEPRVGARQPGASRKAVVVLLEQRAPGEPAA